MLGVDVAHPGIEISSDDEGSVWVFPVGDNLRDVLV